MVVLVDEQDNEIGTALKSEVHTNNTPLHRAFSIFLFNNKGKVLVQQRALSKKTWAGVWSNSCCGHVSPGETIDGAIRRRVFQELGVKIYDLAKVADYRYRFERNGVVENEFCPVYRGVVRGEIKPNDKEIEDWKWINWEEWLLALKKDKPGSEGIWSEWCKEEVLLLDPILAFK